jgi:hypothetical protein
MTVSPQKFEALFTSAFQPIEPAGQSIDVDPAIRMAHAAEYAAAQLGRVLNCPFRIFIF